MKRNIRIILAVVAIIGIGAAVRMVGLNKSPPSLGFDEAALGYNAYSIMKTGKDEYGNWMPLALRSFNDYKPALYAYLTIPFIYFGGLNDAMVRMVSALAGTVSLIFLFLILKRFIKNKYLVIFLFLILSFEPWRLHFSRNAFETHLSMCFFTIGVWFLFRARKKVNLIWSVLFLALAAYSYHSARLSAPLILIFWAIDPIKRIQNKDFWRGLTKYFRDNLSKWLPFGGLILICIPIFIANSGSLLLTRFQQENLFQHYYPYTPAVLLSEKNPMLDIKANPIYYFAGIVTGHVFSNISPINLNFRIYDWVLHSPQFIPGMGMLGWIEGMVFVVGFLVVLRQLGRSEKTRLLIYWIVAGIAPAAATWTWFHPLRSLNIYPALEVIVAIGLVELFRIVNQYVKFNSIKVGIYGITLIILLTTIVFTINNELLYSAYENNGEYQPGGYKEGMSYLKSIQDSYSQVIIDTPHAQPFVFLMFYESMDPTFVQSFASVRPKPGITGNLTFNFGKFIFRKIDWPKDKSLKNTVFWTSPDMTDQEVEAVPGAKIRMKVNNVLYHTADIITTE